MRREGKGRQGKGVIGDVRAAMASSGVGDDRANDHEC